MIRLNAATSNTSKQRRRGGKSTKSGGAGGGTPSGSFNSQKSDGDGTGTHDDMYDDATNKGPSSKVNRLFEELLGDGASAIGSVNKGGGEGEESTAMSSILGPIMKANKGKNGSDNDLGNIDEGKNRGARRGGGGGGGGGLLNVNSSNSPMLNQMKNGRNRNQNNQQSKQQQQNQRQLDEESDVDTYMTKPREIAFDMDRDDVSTLFGGQGGTGGVESYMGTVAAPRKNRQRGGGIGGMGMFGARGNAGGGNSGGGRKNVREEDSRRTGGTTTLQSMGVTTILEEIGMGSTLKKDKGSVDSGDDSGDNKKGHHGGRWSNSRGNRNGSSGRDGPAERRRRKRGHDEGSRFSSSKLLMIVVMVMFIGIQFTTVQKRDKATMDHMNWRFQNHRYADVNSANQPPRYASANTGGGLSPGMRNVATNNVANVGDGRRRGMYNEEDGLGDVLRKTVPLLPQKNNREGGRGAFDDMTGGDGNKNLRGGGGDRGGSDRGGSDRGGSDRGGSARGGSGTKNTNDDWQARKREDDRKIAELMKRKEQEKQRQEQQQQAEKERRRIQEKEEKKQQEFLQNPGDTHPLLKKQDGLSMESAMAKLQNTDRLADIDPPPQQQLSNDILPSRFHVFADLRTPYAVGRDTPFFWHIPRSGGVVVKTMLSHCLGQTLAAEVGELDGHGGDSEIKVISFSEHNYTNVNIATPEGIKRALDLGLVPSHLSDTLVSAHVDLIPSLYNANDRARAFVVFRHPIDRAASMFYFLQGTGYPPLKNMTVDDYAKSELIENNWLVRILSESMTGPINMDNLEIAKEVLRRKFIIGLLDNKRGSFARFDHYFKWKQSPRYEKEFGCRKQLMDEKYTAKHPIRKDSTTWKLLLEQNRFDMHLYDFAKELFSQQSYIFGL